MSTFDFEKALEILKMDRDYVELITKGHDSYLFSKNPELYRDYLAYVNFIRSLSKIYYEKINLEYHLSAEDIARHLDLSLKTVTIEILPNLDKLVFPNLNDKRYKTAIKTLIYDTLYFDSNGNNIKYVESEDFLSKTRKKILYSKDSYVKYLKKHLILRDSKVKIPIKIDKELIKAIDPDKNEKQVIKEVFESFINSEKTTILQSKQEFVFDFNKIVENRFNIRIKEKIRTTSGIDSLLKLENLSSFKSMNTLKTVFDLFYYTEVERRIQENSNYYCDFDLILNLEENKKPSRRIVLTQSFLIDTFKESLNHIRHMANIDVESEDFIVEEFWIEASYIIFECKTYENLEKRFLSFIDRTLSGR